MRNYPTVEELAILLTRNAHGSYLVVANHQEESIGEQKRNILAGCQRRGLEPYHWGRDFNNKPYAFAM